MKIEIVSSCTLFATQEHPHGLTSTSSLLYANVNQIRIRSLLDNIPGPLVYVCAIINYEKQLNRDKR